MVGVTFTIVSTILVDQGIFLHSRLSTSGLCLPIRHQVPKIAPASGNYVDKYRSLCQNFPDPWHNNFLKCMARDVRKVVYFKSEDVSSLRKFMLLVHQTEANHKWPDATLFRECSKTDVLCYFSPSIFSGKLTISIICEF